MKSRRVSVRVNVSVPAALRERMLRHDINWSRVAAEAFRVALDGRDASSLAQLSRLRRQVAAIKKILEDDLP